jgi:hypothetical protein
MQTLPSSRDRNISQYIFGESENKFEVREYANEGTTTQFFFFDG